MRMSLVSRLTRQITPKCLDFFEAILRSAVTVCATRDGQFSERTLQCYFALVLGSSAARYNEMTRHALASVWRHSESQIEIARACAEVAQFPNANAHDACFRRQVMVAHRDIRREVAL